MKRKQQFLKAVQILAPGDTFIFKADQRVPKESLPVYPAGAALKLVVALQKLMPSASYDSSTRSGSASRLHRSHQRRFIDLEFGWDGDQHTGLIGFQRHWNDELGTTVLPSNS